MGPTRAVASLAAAILVVAGSGAASFEEASPSSGPPGEVPERAGSGSPDRGPDVPRRRGGRGSRVLLFEGWAHGPHYGRWSSIDLQEIDDYLGAPAPSLPLGGDVPSLISLARRFGTHRGLRISFDLKILTGHSIPPGIVLGMDLRESPYSNLDQVAALAVDAYRGVAEYSFMDQPAASRTFPVDDAWHRYTVSMDGKGNAAWYRDTVLQAYAAGLPTSARLSPAFWGGAQESRIDNIRVRSGW